MNTQARSFPRRLAVLLLLTAAAWRPAEAKLGSETIAAADPPPTTPTAGVRNLYARYQATSTIAAGGRASVPALVAGEVVETLVDVGDPVIQGQILARVDRQRPSAIGFRAARAMDRPIHRYAAIRAPIAGVVSERRIRPGQQVASGQLAFRITDTSQLVAARLLPQYEPSGVAGHRLTAPGVHRPACRKAWRYG